MYIRNEKWQIPEYTQNVFYERKAKYCLLIPVFNEGGRFQSQIKKMKDLHIFEMIDVIVLDAGSTDGSTDPNMLSEIGFRALCIRKGNGRYSTDLRMGYAWAIEQGYEGFITVDGNDKDGTQAVPAFIEKLNDEYDYIQGSRYIRGGEGINTPISRHLALKLINQPIMTMCAGQNLTDTTNGFRAYSKKFLLDECVQPFRDIFYGYELIYYLPVTACKNNFKVCEIPVVRKYPDNGEVPSKVGGIKGNIYQMSILWHTICKNYNVKKKTLK